MTRAKKLPGGGLQLRMLGRLAVSQEDHAVDLPASRKARALLVYLALTPCATPRNRLCALLFDSTGDARGELRWHLSKLRGIVGAKRVRCSDDAVRLELSESFVDALEIQRAARVGFARLAPEQARALLTLFSGDFLEGMEIDRCPGFTGWLLTQRRRFHAWRIELLQRLVESTPDAEWPGLAEKWLELAPFDVRAHEHLLRAFLRRGHFREGKEHLAASIRLFRAEGFDCTPLAMAWRAASTERTGSAAFKPTDGESEQAYDFFLQGRQHLTRMMRRGLDASRKMFDRSIELDPHYSPAWAGLATVHACLAEWFDPGKVSVGHAERASRRALESAPQLAEAHVARGLARSLSKHYDEATGEFEEAIRINPYLFEAYYYFARNAFARGHMTRAAELFHAATQLRPEDFQSPILLGTAMRALGREDAARDAIRTGIRRAEQILVLNPNDGRALSLGAGALVDDGQSDRALEWSGRALKLYPDDTSALVNIACVHSRLDQRDESLDLLERAFARGCGKRDWVENDPDYSNLRREPRFHQLLSGLR
jgi:DNA-binding SARP family transcriptional activator/tetratricopeptide (TPR) repeat protein